MKTLNNVRAFKEVFSLNNYGDEFIKIGSVRDGFYICLNLTKQRITEEQENTGVHPIIGVSGLKVY